MMRRKLLRYHRIMTIRFAQIQIRTLSLVLFMMTFAACGNPAPVPSVASPMPVLPTLTLPHVTETFTPFPLPTLTPVPTATLTPLNLNPQIILLAENFLEPDDLVLAPNGSIYVSDVTEGTIKEYTTEGQLNTILSGLSAPEGMAFLPDGSMVIAEQGTNRLVRYHLQSKTLLPFLDLVNNTNNLGVDGILFDGTNLIVPDSPNGTVLEVSVDGKTVRQIASGLVRPTGAWTEPDGNLLIADEYGNAVFRLHRDGTLEKVADFPIPDDVIADASGNIFVVTLGDDAVHVLTANQDLILVSGLNNPQGIIFDADGNLIVTDSGNRRLLRVLIH
jgi:sugar lactone lactonase YvrE